MNLESVAKYFAPKSPVLSDASRATASGALTGTDIMAALGLVSSQSALGFDLYLAKIGVSSPERALDGLYDVAEALAVNCRALTRLDETIRSKVLEIMCTFAFQDYCRSAASVRQCDCCAGSGFVDAEVFTNKIYYPDGKPPEWAKITKGVFPSYWEEWKEAREAVRVLCAKCEGKGVISNACRCHGKGTVIDKEESARQGVPVMKTCERCSGRGYSRLPADNVRKAICLAVLNIPETTWRRSFKPLYESLITECHKQEASAEACLQRVTR
ncbi:antitermination protein [Cronobacter sp. EKM101R]|uniref:antitermination protein Q n=1 Tax=Cronobacter TaxID=413496 RepID=UPI0013EBE7C7|nr:MULTISPECIES: antitermination protein [Cronobacter]KAF6589116.1 antitermination protein [Cronobacter sp. EKM101R]KAF6592401.1 antitermination protein [Cronobacter sp. EKM102R]MDK1185194.1 antitermination protein [Cronobacter turicensis]MDK1192390.1 antitermination protein [Cronobacter dublinensis]MDK1203362.1 antitermination protein [Cronobacter dublinensis]